MYCSALHSALTLTTTPHSKCIEQSCRVRRADVHHIATQCNTLKHTCSLLRIIVDYCQPKKKPTIWTLMLNWSAVTLSIRSSCTPTRGTAIFPLDIHGGLVGRVLANGTTSPYIKNLYRRPLSWYWFESTLARFFGGKKKEEELLIRENIERCGINFLRS